LGGVTAKILTRQVVRRGAAQLTPAVLDKLKTAPSYGIWRVSEKCFALTLDRAAPFQVGDSVFCPDRQGNGFVFGNNKIHSSGRLLIKAGSGLVADNELISPHNISVCPEVPGTAAAGIKQLIIRNNLIREAGYFCPAPWSATAGALSITAGGDRRPQLRKAGVFEDLVIEANTFENCNGPNLVISSASGVIVRANKYVNPQQTKPNDTGASYAIANNAVVWVSETENISFAAEQITNPGPFATKAVVLTDSVKTKQ